MIVSIERVELAVLVLHMNIMRQPIKKALKRNYGRNEGKEKVVLYDEVKSIAELEFNRFEEEDVQSRNLELNEEQLEMLHSFLEFYVNELKVQVEKEGELGDNEVFNSLEKIRVAAGDLLGELAEV